MRTVIRHQDTGLYYGKGGKWIANPGLALAFLDEVRARDFTIYRHLARVTVIAVPQDTLPERVPTSPAKARPAVHEPEPEIVTMKRKVAHITSPTKAIAKPPVTAKGTPAVRPENQPAGAQRMASRVAKKKAPAQAATPPAGADQPPATKAVLTTVVVKTDVGFGNTLFIRGQGDGLSWDQGIPLRCVDSSTWVWSTAEAKESLCFKLLLNDRTWSQGENLTAPAGRKTEVSPVF